MMRWPRLRWVFLGGKKLLAHAVERIHHAFIGHGLGEALHPRFLQRHHTGRISALPVEPMRQLMQKGGLARLTRGVQEEPLLGRDEATDIFQHPPERRHHVVILRIAQPGGVEKSLHGGKIRKFGGQGRKQPSCRAESVPSAFAQNPLHKQPTLPEESRLSSPGLRHRCCPRGTVRYRFGSSVSGLSTNRARCFSCKKRCAAACTSSAVSASILSSVVRMRAGSRSFS